MSVRLISNLTQLPKLVLEHNFLESLDKSAASSSPMKFQPAPVQASLQAKEASGPKGNQKIFAEIINNTFQFGKGQPTKEGLERLRSYVRGIQNGKTAFRIAEYHRVLLQVFGEEGIAVSLRALGSMVRMHQILGSKAKLVIEGHASGFGSAEANKNLSQRRADAVKLMLELIGFPAGSLSAIGYGEEKPVAPEKGTAEDILAASRINRRVFVRIAGFN